MRSVVCAAWLLLMLSITKTGDGAEAPPLLQTPPGDSAESPTPVTNPAVDTVPPAITNEPNDESDESSKPPDDETDEAIMRELEAAAAADADATAEREGGGAIEADREAEDPLNQLPEGAQSVIGNEANPALSIILDFAGAYFSSPNRYRQGGHAPTTNGPAVQGAELAATASIDPFFRIDLAFGLYHLHVEEVYFTTTSLPLNLQIRGGIFKANIGRHNPTHLHTWSFVLHPVANEFMFGAEGLGLPGAELSVLLPLPWYVEIVGALQAGEAGAFRTDFSGDPGFLDFIYPVRLVQFFDLSDDIAFQVGLNTVHGTSQNAPEAGNRVFAYGADLLLKWRPIGFGRTGYTFVKWSTEAWFREMEVAQDVWRDAGGYSDLVFGINKNWEAAIRGEVWRRVSGGSTADEMDRTRFGIDANRATGAISFMPSHFSRIRLQYTFEDMASFDVNHIALVQVEVSAGAHGAHKY